MSTKRSVLVTGATGQQGGAVARALLSSGHRVKALTRKPDSDAARIVTPLRACGPAGGSVAKGMKKINYRGYRFPPEIIQQAI